MIIDQSFLFGLFIFPFKEMQFNVIILTTACIKLFSDTLLLKIIQHVLLWYVTFWRHINKPFSYIFHCFAAETELVFEENKKFNRNVKTEWKQIILFASRFTKKMTLDYQGKKKGKKFSFHYI